MYRYHEIKFSYREIRFWLYHPPLVFTNADQEYPSKPRCFSMATTVWPLSKLLRSLLLPISLASTHDELCVHLPYKSTRPSDVTFLGDNWQYSLHASVFLSCWLIIVLVRLLLLLLLSCASEFFFSFFFSREDTVIYWLMLINIDNGGEHSYTKVKTFLIDYKLLGLVSRQSFKKLW